MDFAERNIHLASFPEQNPNPVVEFLMSGEITYANPASKKSFPQLEQQKLAHPIFNSIRNFIEEKNISKISNFITEVKVEGKIFEQKFFFQEKTGILRVYCNDISEYKKQGDKLAQLALFPMQNPNPVIEVNYDTGEISFMNPAAKKQFPAMREADVTHPLFSEIRKNLKDKKDFICEITIDMQIFEQKVFFISDTNLARIYLHDLTERKRSEKNLARLASFPEQNPSPIVELDTNGNITYINTACHNYFPEILSERFDHELLKPFEKIFGKYISGELQDHQHEIKVGEYYFLQRSRFMKENSLVRIFHLDISSQKKAEEIILEKNKDITDSINYAKRIQRSILPTEEELKNMLEDYFVLYIPKDIVSGDFYWANVVHTDTNEKQRYELVAAVDCTGHGVPGALMSIVGSTLLNQTIKNSTINSPADALDFLNRELPKNLRAQSPGEEIRDGMDITMVAITKEKKKMHFAGANNPIYIIRKKELVTLFGDKQPISGSTTDIKNNFTNHTFDLESGDIIYLFTDGYADQFGGPKGKKFKYKQLQEKLIELSHLEMNEQKEKLRSVFEEWKGKLEQVDDVLIIGIKI